jgi:hypothetical protein
MSIKLEVYKRLVDEFGTLPRSEKHEPTFMQITGYPHLENVSSNILKFYLQPENPHGLGTLFLKSLLSFFNYEQITEMQKVRVYREVATTKGKRLDIVVETDSIVLGIENKIHHVAINPFDEYQSYLGKISEGRSVYGLVLSLDESTEETAFCGFRQVSYRMFFEKLKKNFGDCFLLAKEPYITFLRDFIRTIGDLGRGTTMNSAMLSFFQQNRDDIEALLSEISALRKDMRYKVEQLIDVLDASIFPQLVEPKISEGSPDLYTLASYAINVDSEVAIRINVNLSPQGWRINIHHAHGDKLHHRTALQAWFQKHDIPVKPRSLSPWRLGYGSDKLDYQAELSRVQKEVQEFFQAIYQAIEK